MAGWPTQIMADAVNRAYEAGIVIVSAAGNSWVKVVKSVTNNLIISGAI